jgi:hypothetical protein
MTEFPVRIYRGDNRRGPADRAGRARETPVLRGTTEPAEIVPNASTASIPARGSQQTPPPWFSPQLLYIPTWMPPPSPSPPAGVPLPA